MLAINYLLLIKAWPWSFKYLSYSRPSQQKWRTLFTRSKKSNKSDMRWWPFRSAHNGITTRYKGPYLISPPYQVSLELFLITNPTIKDLSHSSLGGPPSKVLTTTPPYFHLNASTHSSPFAGPLYLSIRITSKVNVKHCHLLPLIAILCYKLSKPIY